MSLLTFKPEDAKDGTIAMEPGIHREVKLTAVKYDKDDQGNEIIFYHFAKYNVQKKTEEAFIYRHRWPSLMETKRVEFASNITRHIGIYALDINRPCPELEEVLKLGEPIVNEQGELLYPIDIEGQTYNVNIVLAILNNITNLSQIAGYFDMLRANSPDHRFSIKLCQTVFQGKVYINFKPIDLPFMDTATGGRLRWNPAKDIENPSASNSGANAEYNAPSTGGLPF